MNRSPWFAFEEESRGWAARVREHLAWFCGERAIHARFLNTLSLLEHIGSRKIMKSPAMAGAGQDILKHLAEETRHAMFFKRAAERMAFRPLDYSEANLIAGAWARFYMGRLDAEITQALRDAPPALPYLYMSLIVELRAVWFYRLYQLVLMEKRVPLTLAPILNEEERHLAAMLEHLAADKEAETRIALFAGFERARFLRLWSGIEEDCARLRLAAECV